MQEWVAFIEGFHCIWIDCIMVFGQEQEDGSLIPPMAFTHPLHPMRSRSRNKHQNLWVGWCVSQPWFWSMCSICYLSNWDELSLKKHIHTKVWCGYDGLLDVDFYSFLFGSKCIFQLCSLGFSMSQYVYRYHETFPLNIGLNILPLDSFYVMFIFSTRIFFATDCPCSVWCCGLTTCHMYVGPLFSGNQVWNNSGFVSLT